MRKLLVIIVLVTTGWVLWLFINKGTVVFQGEAPFTVGTTVCTSSPCRVRMRPGAYALTVTKDSFLPDREEVTVARFSTQTVMLHLRRVPSITKVGAYTATETKRPALPPHLSSIAVGWPDADDSFFYLDRQGLFRWDIVSGKATLLAIFPRAISRARVLPSGDGGYVVVWDTDEKRLYLVDIAKKTRQALGNGARVEDAAWRGNFLAVALTQAEGPPQIVLYDTTGKTIATPIFTHLAQTIWDGEGERLIFATDKAFSEFDPANGTSLVLAQPKEPLAADRFLRAEHGAVTFLRGETVYRLTTGR